MVNPENLLGDYWKTCSPDMIPDSTQIHSDFKKLISSGKFLDVGCGIGRKSRELQDIGLETVGVDLNRAALVRGLESINSLVQASANSLPFRSESFDGAIIPGVLGIVLKDQRHGILKEAVRCIKPNGLIYITDFKRSEDSMLFISDEERWVDMYEQDYPTTGEYGSVVVNNSDGSPRFISHHFEEDEIVGALRSLGIEILGNKLIEVESQVNGEKIMTINVWGRK